MKRPLVTIGIPSYNRPEGLAHTLKRAVAQTYPNLDILVSDNCSQNEAAVRTAVESYRGDTRVRFFRQPMNLGSLGNFSFLAEYARGEYFLWMADDDDVELNYVEELVNRLGERPDAAIVFGGYDIEDTMAHPPIHLDLTKHHQALEATTAFERIKNYILQPDHLAKSRLNWGMFPTPLIRRAFAECRRHLPPSSPAPIWADFPLDLRLLSYGELTVIRKTLWHVKLLPTSDGRMNMSGTYAKLKDIASRTQRSLSACVDDADLKPEQKSELKSILRKRARREKVQLFVYYRVIARWPRLARWIKKLWYLLFS